MEKFSLYFLLFIIYSFIGWAWEVIDKIVEEKKFVNRGFLVGPICPIYGVGCLSLIFLLDKYKNDFLVLFVMAIIICSILEYFTSYFMEKLFNARWWDYSKQKFNINGRICAETMIPFGIFGSLIVAIINPKLISILYMIPVNIFNTIAVNLFIIFIVDFIISANIIVKFRNTITIVEKDATEEITKKVKEVFENYGGLYKRLMKAFPNFLSHNDYLKKIRSKLTSDLIIITNKINNSKNN